MQRLEQIIPFAGCAIGGFVAGVIARNGFLNWTGETLVAGLLGLTGGWLAYKAATDMRRATEQRNAFIFKTHHFAKIEQAAKILKDFSERDLYDTFDTIDGFNKIEVERAIHTLTDTMTFPEPLPSKLSKKIAACCDFLTTFNACFIEPSHAYKRGKSIGSSFEDPAIVQLMADYLSDAIQELKNEILEHNHFR